MHNFDSFITCYITFCIITTLLNGRFLHVFVKYIMYSTDHYLSFKIKYNFVQIITLQRFFMNYVYSLYNFKLNYKFNIFHLYSFYRRQTNRKFQLLLKFSEFKVDVQLFYFLCMMFNSK